MKRELLRTSAFARTLKKHLKSQSDATESIGITLSALSDDAFQLNLKTHKLKGSLAGYWACSAEYDLRIVFEFVDEQGKEAILLHDIGPHDEVY